MRKTIRKVFSFRSLVLVGMAILLVAGSILYFPSIFENKDKGGVRADIPRVEESNDPEFKYEYETATFKLFAGEEDNKPKVEIRQGNRVLEMVVGDEKSYKKVPTKTVEPSPTPTEVPGETSENFFNATVNAQENLTSVNTDTESYIEYGEEQFTLKPDSGSSTLEFTVENANSLPVISVFPRGLEGFKLGNDVVFATRTNRKAYSFNSGTVADANGESGNVIINVEKSSASTETEPLEIVNFSVDGAWLNSPSRKYPLTLTAKLNALFDKKMLHMKPKKPTYSANENLEFEIDTFFMNDLTLQSKILRGDFEGVRFGLIDTRGETVELDAKLKESQGDIAVLELTTRRPMVKAGLFDLLLQYGDNPAYISESEVAWGVLALNPDQSVYKTGSTANMDFAVLDKHGMMVCEAELSLTITEPDGNQSFFSTDAGNIEVTDGCKQRITDLPDFNLKYQVKGEGEYKLDLMAETKDGVFSINDKFKVDDNSPFYIKRKSHTRIFPWITYGMEIEVIKGTSGGNVFITEKFDKDFIIISTNGEEMPVNGYEKSIVWNVNFDEKQSHTLGYRYDAPDKSPAMLLMGPLAVSDKFQTEKDRKELFNEGRAWQIAVDAVEVLNSGTTYNVPSAWNDNNNTIEVIGGGGAGVTGASNNTPGGGGGGGGAYAKSLNINLPEGSTVTYAIGAGGATSAAAGGNTWFCKATTSCANFTDTNVRASAAGASAASGATGGTGGSATAGVKYNNETQDGASTVEMAGGTGGNGAGTTKGRGAGGGGGAGGPGGNGQIGGNAAAVAASGGGGGGGNGGGGAGANSTTTSGGNGGTPGTAAGGTGDAGNTCSSSGGNGSDGASGGGGGGGGGKTQAGGNTGAACQGGTGSQGTEWTGAGSGGGGGGGGGKDRTTGTGNDGGAGGAAIANTGAGGGGGGSCGDTGCAGGSFAAGGSGVIIITYTPTGPTTADVMRHGNWFSGGSEQGFYWAN